MQPEVFPDKQGRLPRGSLFVGLFAASFYVLVTPMISGMPVRVGISELLLAAFLGICALYWRHLNFDAIRRERRILRWLPAIALVIVVAFLKGPKVEGAFRSWALMKTIGFFLLLAYFAAGVMLAAQVRTAWGRTFVKGFILAGWISAAYALLRFTLAFWAILPEPYFPRMAAFAQNPNAFGIVLAAAVVLQLAFARDRELFHPRIQAFGAGLLLLDIFLAASRSGYLALLFGLVALLIIKRLPILLLVRSVAVSGVAFVMLFMAPPILEQVPPLVASWFPTAKSGGAAPKAHQKLFVWRARTEMPMAVTRDQEDVGLTVRIRLVREAVALWLDHPWLGAGLGGFLQEQTRHHSSDQAGIHVNHNTALWLLSETGVLGFGIFFGFFVTCALVLYRKTEYSMFATAAFGILAAMAGASAGTEILYQRYLWILLGIGVTQCFTGDGPSGGDERLARGDRGAHEPHP